MKKMILVIIAITIVMSGCSVSTLNNAEKEINDVIKNQTDSDNKYVLMVKNGYRTDDPDLTYDMAFSNFFATPRWTYFKSDDNKDVVEFTGDCTYSDAPVKARIQFIVDEENGTFNAEYLAFNEVPQNNLTLIALIEKAFSEYENTTAKTTDSATFAVTETTKKITEKRSEKKEIPIAYGQDILDMTIGEIKKKYNVSVMKLDCPYGPNHVYVTFSEPDGTEWNYYPIVNTFTGMDIYSAYVPDDAQPIGVYLGQGAYLDEYIYVGMTYNEIREYMGTALGNQQWDDLTEKYTASFAYTYSNGTIGWTGNADGKSTSIEYYTKYIPEPEYDSSQTSCFSDYEIECIRYSLGVPDNMDVTMRIGTPYYWDGGDCQMCHVSVLYNEEIIASGDFAIGDIDICKSLMPFSYIE